MSSNTLLQKEYSQNNLRSMENPRKESRQTRPLNCTKNSIVVLENLPRPSNMAVELEEGGCGITQIIRQL